MNPQDPLAALHPLRDPTAIGWWPLAPGWWVLIAVLILLLLALAVFYYRRYRANAYRRQAAQQLEALHSHWLGCQDSTSYLRGINALLKSVALRAFPRGDVASKSGEDWIAFLNQTNSSKNAKGNFTEDFASAAYRPQSQEVDCEALMLSARLWIKQHRPLQ